RVSNLSHSLATDVLIVGGGAAGVAAAVGASRAGMKTTIIERYGFFGGMATSALVGTICGLYLRNQSSNCRWATQGFAREFGERMQAIDGSRPLGWRQGLWFLPYRPFTFRRVCDEFLNSVKIVVLPHTVLHEVTTQGSAVATAKALCWEK